MKRYQVRLESPKEAAAIMVAAIMPSLRDLFGESATFDFRTFPSRYGTGQALTYIDINKIEEAESDD